MSNPMKKKRIVGNAKSGRTYKSSSPGKNIRGINQLVKNSGCATGDSRVDRVCVLILDSRSVYIWPRRVNIATLIIISTYMGFLNHIPGQSKCLRTRKKRTAGLSEPRPERLHCCVCISISISIGYPVRSWL